MAASRQTGSPPHNKKGRHAAGLLRIQSGWRKSVLRDHRATPAIVDADGDEIDVLADAIDRGQHAGGVGEADVAVAHEQMIVLDGSRPVRGEAIFEADADSAAPAGFTRRVENRIGCREAVIITIRRHGGAALHIEQRVVPRVSDLTREQAKGADARTRNRIAGSDDELLAYARALEVGPVTLCFEAEDPGGGLKAITDLTTGDTAGRIMTSFGEKRARHRDDIPALVARTPTTVGADIETAPVVDGGDHRGRLGVGARSEISSSGRSRECNESNRTQQKLFHRGILQFCRFSLVPKRF